jgi:peptidoglycan DL-endopeptidase CwlO
VANRPSRRLRLAVLVTAIATAAVVVPTVAGAVPASKSHNSKSHHTSKSHPKATIASVEKQLSVLARKNTQLVESFDEARIAVTSRQKAAAAAERVVTAADAALSQAHVLLSESALAEFEGGSFESAGALLSSNSGSSYIDQLDTMQMITTHSAQVVSSYMTAQQAAAAAKRKAAQLLSAATQTLNALASARKTVQQQVAKFSALLRTLTASQRTVFQNRMDPAASRAQRMIALSNIPAISDADIRRVVAFAVAQVGKPYSWGAAGPGSYDCSGLTMASYHVVGVNLPHSAADQYNYGQHVAFSDLQPGDLLFFYRPRIGHVTMYIGDGLMVSAPETGEDVTIIPDTSFGDAYVGATRIIAG